MGEDEVHITFQCSACGVETDIRPGIVSGNLSIPSKDTWKKRKKPSVTPLPTSGR